MADRDVEPTRHFVAWLARAFLQCSKKIKEIRGPSCYIRMVLPDSFNSGGRQSRERPLRPRIIGGRLGRIGVKFFIVEVAR